MPYTRQFQKLVAAVFLGLLRRERGNQWLSLRLLVTRRRVLGMLVSAHPPFEPFPFPRRRFSALSLNGLNSQEVPEDFLCLLAVGPPCFEVVETIIEEIAGKHHTYSNPDDCTFEHFDRKKQADTDVIHPTPCQVVSVGPH